MLLPLLPSCECLQTLLDLLAQHVTTPMLSCRFTCSLTWT
jgi:hypothetical protein